MSTDSDTLVPPPVSEWPTVRPNGEKIMCPLCIDANGWPPPSDPAPHYWWTRRHMCEHVRCECGVVRTPNALPAHRRSKRHLQWEHDYEDDREF